MILHSFYLFIIQLILHKRHTLIGANSFPSLVPVGLRTSPSGGHNNVASCIQGRIRGSLWKSLREARTADPLVGAV